MASIEEEFGLTGRPFIQNEFTRLSRESEAFPKYISQLIHRHLSAQEIESMPTQEHNEGYPRDVISMVKFVDDHFVDGCVEDVDPENVTVRIQYGTLDSGGMSDVVCSLVFSDMVDGESVVVQVKEGAKDAKPVLIADDSVWGWQKVNNWGDKHGVVILWWPSIKDSYHNWTQFSEMGDLGVDMWERGHRVGFKRGFSEGFAQATREIKKKLKEGVKNAKRRTP